MRTFEVELPAKWTFVTFRGRLTLHLLLKPGSLLDLLHFFKSSEGWEESRRAEGSLLLVLYLFHDLFSEEWISKIVILHSN